MILHIATKKDVLREYFQIAATASVVSAFERSSGAK
jgi:hypothetical protein